MLWYPYLCKKMHGLFTVHFELVVYFHFCDVHGNVGIHFVVNGALSRIEGSDLRHFFRCKFKIKDLEVFFHSSLTDCLGNNDDIPLNESTQHDLTYSLSMVFSNDL